MSDSFRPDAIITAMKADPSLAWQNVELTFLFDAANPIQSGAGTILWTPPQAALVRGLIGWVPDVAGNPLADNGGSGATQVSLGMDNFTTLWLGLTGFAQWNVATRVLVSGIINHAAVFAAGQIAGDGAANRHIRAFANAGSVIGSFAIRFQWLAF